MIYINSCRATILQVIYLLTFNVLTADLLTALCDINTLSAIQTYHSVMACYPLNYSLGYTQYLYNGRPVLALATNIALVCTCV